MTKSFPQDTRIGGAPRRLLVIRSRDLALNFPFNDNPFGQVILLLQVS